MTDTTHTPLEPHIVTAAAELRVVAIRHDEQGFAHLVDAALAGEGWALDRLREAVERVLDGVASMFERVFDPGDTSDALALRVIRATDTTLWFPDRSPTGHAAAGVATYRDGAWCFLADDGTARYLPLPADARLFASKGDALLEARFTWRCDGSRPRCARPIAAGVVRAARLDSTHIVRSHVVA